MRINILYWIIPLVAWALFSIYQYLSRGSASFYGVAENQETQINLDHPVTVNRIYYTQGQFVSKGALLMEVTRTALDLKMSDLTHGIAELQVRDQLHVAEIRGDLERLRAERAEKSGVVQARIRVLESEQSLNQSLFRDLRSISVADTGSTGSTPYSAKIQALRDELRLLTQPLDVEIARLEQELKMASLPVQTQISRLKNEVDVYRKEQERLKIYAPSDGLVGTVHCRQGENVSAFSPLISFYEQNPNTVVAYVHESMILQIKIGDSLNVISSLHAEEHCRGHVSGLGHRVVEIPERLRKIPEVKSYGREILISIPPNNNFLQKEKVVLQRLDAGTSLFLSLFQPSSALPPGGSPGSH